MPRLPHRLELLEFGAHPQRHLLRTAVGLIDSMDRLAKLRSRRADSDVLVRATERQVDEYFSALPTAFTAAMPRAPQRDIQTGISLLLKDVRELTQPQRQRILTNTPEPTSRGFADLRYSPPIAVFGAGYFSLAGVMGSATDDMAADPDLLALDNVTQPGLYEQAVVTTGSVVTLVALGLAATAHFVQGRTRAEAQRQLRRQTPQLLSGANPGHPAVPLLANPRNAGLIDVVICARVDQETGLMSPTAPPRYFRSQVSPTHNWFNASKVDWEEIEAPRVPRTGLVGRDRSVQVDEQNLMYPVLIRYVDGGNRRMDVFPDPDGKKATVALDGGSVTRVKMPEAAERATIGL